MNESIPVKIWYPLQIYKIKFYFSSRKFSNLTLYQQGAYNRGFKIFHRLPSYIKEITHKNNEFKLHLKIFFIPTINSQICAWPYNLYIILLHPF